MHRFTSAQVVLGGALLLLGGLAHAATTATPTSSTTSTTLRAYEKACIDHEVALPLVLPVPDGCTPVETATVEEANVGDRALVLQANPKTDFPMTSSISRIGATPLAAPITYKQSGRTITLDAPLPVKAAKGASVVFGSSKECNGWDLRREFAAGTKAHDPAGELAFPFQRTGKARLYRWEGTLKGKDRKTKTTVCFYLYRGVGFGVGTNNNAGNGVLCFNTETCEACAFDDNQRVVTTWPQLTTGDDLKNDARDPGNPTMKLPGGEGLNPESCWRCHAPGPVVAKFPFLDRGVRKVVATPSMGAINRRCASVGGPKWVTPSAEWQADPTWGAQAQVKLSIGEKLQEDCGSTRCHPQGFVQAGFKKKAGGDVGPAARNNRFCRLIVDEAFHDGGAMRDDGQSFTKREDCLKLAAELGCTEAEFNCPAAPPTTVPPTTTTRPATTTTRPGTTTTRPSTTTTTTRPTTTTTLPGPGTTVHFWKLSANIARTQGSPIDVSLPRRSGDLPLPIAIPNVRPIDFPFGRRVPGPDIQAAAPDIYATLLEAAEAFIRSSPPDTYPLFDHVIELNWAERDS